MANFRQRIALWLVKKLFRMRLGGVDGLGLAQQGGGLVIANHDHPLDWVILAPFLPKGSQFALHPVEMPPAWLRSWCDWLDFVALDPMDPTGIKPLIRHLKNGGVVALFPSGGAMGLGAVGKILDGPASLPQLAGVPVVAVWMQGTARWKQGCRWPKIEMAVQTGKMMPESKHTGEVSRREAVLVMGDWLELAAMDPLYRPKTLWHALHQAVRDHGRSVLMVEDSGGAKLTYGTFLARVMILARILATRTHFKERVGVMLPTTSTTLVLFFALQSLGRIPAMLNFTAGAGPVRSACQTAGIRSVLTSRLFVDKAGLESIVTALSGEVTVVFLENIKPMATRPFNLLMGWLTAFLPPRMAVDTTDEAVILFTSGTEGEPKGVVLSHAALLANMRQVQVRVGLGRFFGEDLMLDVLPMFHAFGLTVAALTPLLSGVRLYIHPSPLDYRFIAELASRIKPTLLVGTDTFLSGYGRMAHPGDFASLRQVFAGGEPLREHTRVLWLEKFGVPIFEGYGATETGPALTVNVPVAHQPGSVGRLLPGISYRLEAVPGVAEGGRLCVSAPNLMVGYILPGGDGQIVPVALEGVGGWYDVGDVVTVDGSGYVRIVGRLKRFAKIGGEMVSLAAVEALADAIWPLSRHAAITWPDGRKGECIVLVTEQPAFERKALLEQARRQGLGAVHLPTHSVIVQEIPLLGPGKVDYQSVRVLAKVQLSGSTPQATS